MNRQNEGSRVGSRAFIALVKLHGLGGQTSLADWMGHVGFLSPVKQFKADIVNILKVRGKIFERNDVYHISDAGLVHIGVAVDAAPVVPALPAPSRRAPPRSELRPQNITRLALMREGALDYRNIPSRIGDQLVPHGSKPGASA